MYLAEAASAGNSSLTAIIIGAVVSIITAITVPAFTLRSSTRAAQQQAQQAVLQQGNLQYDRLKAACDEAEKERDEARRDAGAYRRERDDALDELARLRHRIWAAGLDPDTIRREPPPRAKPP